LVLFFLPSVSFGAAVFAALAGALAAAGALEAVEAVMENTRSAKTVWVGNGKVKRDDVPGALEATFGGIVRDVKVRWVGGGGWWWWYVLLSDTLYDSRGSVVIRRDEMDEVWLYTMSDDATLSLSLSLS
jgi:hypothetical protein